MIFDWMNMNILVPFWLEERGQERQDLLSNYILIIINDTYMNNMLS
jgi:hypothetical protein